MPEGCFLYHFVAFWRGSFCTTFFRKAHITAARSENGEIQTVPPEGAGTVPHLGSLLGPQMWYNFRPFEVVQFVSLNFALSFPCLGLIGAFLKQNIIFDSQVGTSGVTVSNCWKYWVLLFRT